MSAVKFATANIYPECHTLEYGIGRRPAAASQGKHGCRPFFYQPAARQRNPSVDRAAALAAESQIDALTVVRSAAHFDGATPRLDNACPPDTHPLGLVERSVFRAAATNVTLLDIAAALVTVLIA